MNLSFVVSHKNGNVSLFSFESVALVLFNSSYQYFNPILFFACITFRSSH